MYFLILKTDTKKYLKQTKEIETNFFLNTKKQKKYEEKKYKKIQNNRKKYKKIRKKYKKFRKENLKKQQKIQKIKKNKKSKIVIRILCPVRQFYRRRFYMVIHCHCVSLDT